ncbi:formylmethanofuran dehydrogenase subunit A [Archaeoglobus veneficus]|uniref:Formylmethanofuran dehydrogenase subunit A n=1 Tax=Archaeoglobus veneficus (strain DSM 11195 / SNP6) TaxID=693661 RepID=F2KT95_ARCVS|nr:formylmethanofuran dehydrogenase subunit A [Archaeoglobus veneficus]AEA47125.1 formylmethanofuran dehydrogenase subunit A [Archaeoglobus veneficus SNP6]
MKLVLKNGIVYDPINGINGEKMDIYIKDGRIVDRIWFGAKVIDVSNKLVMPGGFDIHSHVAGGKENAGRMLRPEDSLRKVFPKNNGLRSGSGYSVPSIFLTGYEYARMGYTTVITPAMPPLFARHTHHELNELPILDKAAFPLLDGNWFVMDCIAEGDIEMLKNYVAWLLEATKGYAIKLVNPGGTEAWGWRREIACLDDPVPLFEVTPREIICCIMRVCEDLNLPHSVHLHCNNLGMPGNYETTLQTIKIAGRMEAGDRQLLHLTHVQFHSYGGDSWRDFESRSDEIAKYVDRHSVTIDTGNIMFGDTTTMTADGPMEFHLQLLTGRKWMNKDVEAETAPGVTPVTYSPRSAVNAVQWAIGLELALLVDTEKVMLTTDHPNGAPFTAYPKVIAMLMSRKYREKEMAKVNRAVESRTMLGAIDREYDFYEIAMVTRSNQAKATGMLDRGHLGVGAVADIAVYDINPLEVNSSDYRIIEKAFSSSYLTIKDGEIVVRDGEVVNSTYGRTYWVKTDYEKWIERELRRYFAENYSVSMQNFIVESDELRRAECVCA